MKPNVGTLDRIARVIIGLSILAFGYFQQSWWGLIGLGPILAALIGYCPVYVPFGINTCRRK